MAIPSRMRLHMAKARPSGSAPANTVAPVISGTPTVGQALSVTLGTWSGSAASFTQQWKADGVAIAGATASMYTPVTGDIGKIISCTLTGMNAYGSGSVTASGIGPIAAASSFDGGSTTAKSGTIQYPTLLDASAATNLNGKTFASRPPQPVPGVDFHTGPQTGRTFYDITSSVDRAAHFPSGWNWDSTNHIIEITGPGTLDGWNLDIGSPTTTIQNTYVGSGTVTITNNNWKSYGNLPFIQDMWNGGHTGLMEVGWNKLDGNLLSSDFIRRGYTGGYIMQLYVHHNDFQNGAEDCIVINGPFTDMRVQSNSFVNFGTTASAHSDMVLQVYIAATSTGATTLTGLVVEDNLLYQPGPNASNLPGVANSMVRCGGNATALTLVSPRIRRNTIVGIGYTSHLGAAGTDYPALGTILQGFGDATDSKTSDLVATGNFLYTDAAPGKAWNTGNTGGNGVDYGGCYNTPWQMIHGNNAPYLTTADISGNYDMRTGAALTAVAR